MSQSRDEDVLLQLVPADGNAIGNVSLIRQLRWDENKYWRVREKLLSDGVLTRGRGKGGSVRRAAPIEAANAGARATQGGRSNRSVEAGERALEGDLYKPLLQVLSTEWTREMRVEADQIHFEITARQGKKATGGKWTRPDISAVSVRSFPHLPEKYLDIWTFEVKPSDYLDVTAIYEAAAHGARATRSYALLHVADQPTSSEREILERCEREAARLRVGLVTFTVAHDFQTWETLVEASRLVTAPEDLEEFIAHLSADAKRKLTRWK